MHIKLQTVIYICVCIYSWIILFYFQGYMQKKNFVATQAPLANTIVDFWKMVWKTESKTIVMLCNLQENGKVDICTLCC